MNCKIIFFFALLICNSNSFSQRVKRKGVEPMDISKNKKNASGTPVFKIEQCLGKWQETSRGFEDNLLMRYNDTIFLEIDNADKAITKQGMTAKMIGEAGIGEPGNVLLIAADVYTILSVDSISMVLQDDDKTTHTFEKKDFFWNEILSNVSFSGEVYKDPVSPVFSSVSGKWKVYRRQSKPGSLDNNVKLLKSFSITDSTGEKTARGEIVFYVSEKTEVVPCIIYFTNTGFKITADKNSWEMKLYKANGKELIFGDTDVLLYFAKPM